MYTHLSASLQGLTTIRAFGAQEILIKEFDNYQDAYTSAFFLFLSANRSFGFWIDFFCVTFVAIVTISILFIQNGKNNWRNNFIIVIIVIIFRIIRREYWFSANPVNDTDRFRPVGHETME